MRGIAWADRSNYNTSSDNEDKANADNCYSSLIGPAAMAGASARMAGAAAAELAEEAATRAAEAHPGTMALAKKKGYPAALLWGLR